nr:hypothetical protein [Tanacetum cinerariifolium]
FGSRCSFKLRTSYRLSYGSGSHHEGIARVELLFVILFELGSARSKVDRVMFRKTFQGTLENSRGTLLHGRRNKTGSLYLKTYWELLPKDILGATTQRYSGRSKDILGVITQSDTGSYYPKRYWELLPKDIVGDPNTYMESLPKVILGATTQRDTRSYYPKI